jgi:peroxiredoxin
MEIKALEGRQVDSLIVVDSLSKVSSTVGLRGRPRIIYLFATDCPYCTAQKRHIGELLGALDSADVVTASDEGVLEIRHYWDSSGVRLPQPLSLHEQSIRRLDGYTVPRLYFVSSSGTVQKVIQGTVLNWSVENLKRALKE